MNHLKFKAEMGCPFLYYWFGHARDAPAYKLYKNYSLVVKCMICALEKLSTNTQSCSFLNDCISWIHM